MICYPHCGVVKGLNEVINLKELAFSRHSMKDSYWFIDAYTCVRRVEVLSTHMQA